MSFMPMFSYTLYIFWTHFKHYFYTYLTFFKYMTTSILFKYMFFLSWSYRDVCSGGVLMSWALCSYLVGWVVFADGVSSLSSTHHAPRRCGTHSYRSRPPNGASS